MAKTPMDLILDGVTWEPVEPQGFHNVDDASGLPYATHEGVLNIGGHDLRCFRLSNGQAMFHAEDFENFFGNFLAGDK